MLFDSRPSLFLTFTEYTPTVAPVMNSLIIIFVAVLDKMVPFPTKAPVAFQ
jgi:hypothetical protein